MMSTYQKDRFSDFKIGNKKASPGGPCSLHSTEKLTYSQSQPMAAKLQTCRPGVKLRKGMKQLSIYSSYLYSWCVLLPCLSSSVTEMINKYPS